MLMLFSKRVAIIAITMTMAFSLLLTPAPRTEAADHGDAPLASGDQNCDIADVYIYLDPNDNSRLVIAFTIRGFIPPGEAVNFGYFDHNIRYLLDLETNGDARADQNIDIRFTERTSTSVPQTATVILPFGQIFQAPTTLPTLADNPNPAVITTDPITGVQFFAGIVDDPFRFDIPGFGRFVSSVLAGSPNPAVLQRGRDSFAGYNLMGVALSIPISVLRVSPTSTVGVNFRAQRQRRLVNNRDGSMIGTGGFINCDRMGNPGVNVALIPFARKNEYNGGTTLEDSQGRFANSIVGTLTALGTNASNIGVLANLAVVNGDYLRVSLGVANSGPGGGNNAGGGFPNGRRLGDDVIDTFLTVATNGAVTTDNANTLDVPLRDAFPFFGPPQQPRAAGVIDDNTRN